MPNTARDLREIPSPLWAARMRRAQAVSIWGDVLPTLDIRRPRRPQRARRLPTVTSSSSLAVGWRTLARKIMAAMTGGLKLAC